MIEYDALLTLYNVLKTSMKTLILFIGVLTCASCAKLQPHPDNEFHIVPPVKQRSGPGEPFTFHLYNDGGTKMIRVTDARGQVFEVYFDHRIGHQTNWGAIYINGYPDDPGSIRVSNPFRFRTQILKDIKFPSGF
jgi:hypothetical protein